MAGQTLLPATTASGASATKVMPPTDGDAEGVNLLWNYATAINDNAGITDDHEERISALEQFGQAPNQFAGYGPTMFAFTIGASGEFQTYVMPAQLVASS